MVKNSEMKNALIRWWVKNIGFLVITGVILFISAGTIHWVNAWFYLVTVLFIILANAFSSDKALLVERSKLQNGTKGWDVILAPFVAMWGPMLLWLIAGLDHRWKWSQPLPLWVTLLALALVLGGGLLATWAMAVNRFFASTVRIQDDRQQYVVDQRPYSIVRHPGYSGAIINYLFTTVLLGSWFALIPAVLVTAGFVLRTYLEDQTLKKELPGYDEYSKKVRYCLFPRVW
jgi:protein-S-isoprenylcysteine O-methyltransferase Ste14